MVLPEATTITTPLHPKEWQKLCEHSDKTLINFFISGLTHGFRVGFKNSSSKLHSTHKNLAGAVQNPRWWMIISKQRLPNIVQLALSAKQTSQMPTLADLGSSLNTIDLKIEVDHVSFSPGRP